MKPEASDWQAVMGRLEKLERQNRHMKQMGVVVLILVAAVLLMGQASPPRTVEANEFILRDGNGRVRGRLAMTPDGPHFALIDMFENEVVAFNVIDDLETRLTLRGSVGYRSSISLSNSVRGPHLSMADVGGRNRVLLSIGYEGPELAFLDLAGNHALSLESVFGGSRVSLSDTEGFQTTIGTTDLLTPLTGETSKTSAASVILFDKDKNVLWKAP